MGSAPAPPPPPPAPEAAAAAAADASAAPAPDAAPAAAAAAPSVDAETIPEDDAAGEAPAAAAAAPAAPASPAAPTPKSGRKFAGLFRTLSQNLSEGTRLLSESGRRITESSRRITNSLRRVSLAHTAAAQPLGPKPVWAVLDGLVLRYFAAPETSEELGQLDLTHLSAVASPSSDSEDNLYIEIVRVPAHSLPRRWRSRVAHGALSVSHRSRWATRLGR